MKDHPLRQEIIEEMHLRRWPALRAPSTLVQILRIVPPHRRDEERAALLTLFGDTASTREPRARHIAGRPAEGVRATWERHTEGSSIAIHAEGALPPEGFASTRKQLETLPGDVLRATEIIIVEDDKAAGPALADAAFNKAELVSSLIGPGIRFWSDFRLRANRYGRVVIAANGADPLSLSRSVQQLQELGNYRNLALLGLPPVRQQWTRLDEVEADIARFAADVSDVSTRDDRLLEDVSDVSLELANLVAEVGYRLDATKAYAELVAERLEDLAPRPIDGFHSLADFTRRRLAPAVRTCAAHDKRLAQLSDRAARLTALLRARVETRIENQNARLLSSMDQTGQRQMRLQQLVEGLSVFALAYYGVGLIGYVLGGLEEVAHIPSPPVIEALAVPTLMLGIWLTIKLVKRRIFAEDG